MSNILKGFLTTKEFSDKLGYADPSVVRKMIFTGIIKSKVKLAGVWLISSKEAKRLLKLGYGKNTLKNKDSLNHNPQLSS